MKSETDFSRFNTILNEIRSDFEDFCYFNRNSLQYFSARKIRDLVLKRKEQLQNPLLKEAYETYYTEVIEKNKHLSPGTKKNYRKSKTHFYNFLQSANLSSIELSDFKRTHASKFKDYLLSDELNITEVTAQSLLKNVKPFFRRQFEDEVINRNPFNNVVIHYTPVQQHTLTIKEFKKLKNLDVASIPNLEYYRDIFLLMCYTGIIYSDLMALTRKELIFSNKEVKLFNQRGKTGVQYAQFLSKPAIAIIEKYADHPNVIITKKLVPSKSLNEINKNLQIIGAFAGLEKKLTTYYSRRMFSDFIYHAGIGEGTIKKTMMGHSTRSSIESRYNIMNDSKLLKATNKLNKFYKKKNLL